MKSVSQTLQVTNRPPSRTFYRALEILPGALAWGTLIAMVLVSAYLPIWAAIFIILFDIYWFFKVLTLSTYLTFTYRKMRENMAINWLDKCREIVGWGEVRHLVIFPMVKEPYEVVKETFESLRKKNYPKDKFIVVLSVEERAGAEAWDTAKRIEKEFGSDFYKFMTTRHPHNLEGEIPGKGSNQAWAAVEVKREVIDKEKIPYDKILTSVFDVDTQVYPEYFGRLTHAFLTDPDPQRASYQPIPLFNNNIYQAPAFARVISLSASYYQMMQQARPENLTTFSSHSVPFKSLVEVGFWQKDVVSEDSRIFWQFFTHYDGQWRVVPLAYPVSMDANAAPTFWQTIRNVYKQQRRWAWGAENIAYIITNFVKNKKIKLKQKLYWGFHSIESFHSWGTASLLIFAMGWLPLFLGGEEFNTSLLSFNLPEITANILSFTTIGIALAAILGIVSLPPKPEWFKPRHYLLYLAQWLLLPVTMIVLGSVPALDAHTRLILSGRFRLGFWVTPKSRKQDGKRSA